ncbi:hypothetical protein PAEVO_28620 [Paenibacillus sp. GM2FR]|nr:hypothetical protein PAEVO_28620 [Paenibacillus sp. GM2FR]
MKLESIRFFKSHPGKSSMTTTVGKLEKFSCSADGRSPTEKGGPRNVEVRDEIERVIDDLETKAEVVDNEAAAAAYQYAAEELKKVGL